MAGAARLQCGGTDIAPWPAGSRRCGSAPEEEMSSPRNALLKIRTAGAAVGFRSGVCLAKYRHHIVFIIRQLVTLGSRSSREMEAVQAAEFGERLSSYTSSYLEEHR